jgi:hypothetical protein
MSYWDRAVGKAFVLTRAIRGTVEDVLWGACPRPRCVPFVELSRMSCGVHVPDPDACQVPIARKGCLVHPASLAVPIGTPGVAFVEDVLRLARLRVKDPTDGTSRSTS